MEVHYCKQWDRVQRRPDRMLSLEDAQKAWQKYLFFTALVGDPQQPDCYLQFSRYRGVYVDFLDDALRRRLLYSFERVRSRLFLTMAVWPHYLDGSDEPQSENIYHYDHHTKLQVAERRERAPGGLATVERVERTIRMLGNWEPMPEFGQFESITRVDRKLPALRDAYVQLGVRRG